MNTKKLFERIERRNEITDPHARWLVDFGRERNWGMYVMGQHELTLSTFPPLHRSAWMHYLRHRRWNCAG
jgi:hypothetical protein